MLKVDLIRFSTTLARPLPAIDSRDIPRRLSQAWWFLLLLCRCMMGASLKSCGSVKVPRHYQLKDEQPLPLEGHELECSHNWVLCCLC